MARLRGKNSGAAGKPSVKSARYSSFMRDTELLTVDPKPGELPLARLKLV